MPQSRKSQVNLNTTTYYHCISRCVRRAYLCGKDKLTGQSYEHRRKWVEDKLLLLTQIFAIDVCAYAIMSNHSHIVLHVDEKSTEDWSIEEVLFRWHQIFKGSNLTLEYLQGRKLTENEYKIVKEAAGNYRKRLSSISWFMRVLNEYIARKANKEDECTGRFWEGRFKSQALLDESALLACMAYVDLNPVRAGIAKSPETSEYTSIKKRLKALLTNGQPEELRPFKHEKQTQNDLNFNLLDYIELVNMTSKVIVDKSRLNQSFSSNLLKILKLDVASWFVMTQKFTSVFHGAVGKTDSLSQYCSNQNKKRRRNLSICQQLLA